MVRHVAQLVALLLTSLSLIDTALPKLGVRKAPFATALGGPTPRLLIDRALIAHGGINSLADDLQSTLVATLAREEYGSRRASLRLRFERRWPDVRVQIDNGGLIETSVTSGTIGWDAVDGVVRELTSGEVAETQHYDPERALIMWLISSAQSGSKLTSHGPAVLPDGVPCIQIGVRRPAGDGVDLYLDPSTSCVRAIGYGSEGSGSGTARPNVLCYSNYYKLGRAILPREIRLYHLGRLAWITTVLRARRHVSLPRRLFGRPTSVQGIGRTTIPFVLCNGIPLVQVHLNRRLTRWFIIDTGSYVSVIGNDTARDLHLSTHGKAAGFLSFWPVGFQIGRVKRFRVGGSTASNLLVEVCNYPLSRKTQRLRPAGLLGYNFLGRFGVHLDYSLKLLSLEPRSSSPVRSGSISLSLCGGEPWIKVGIGNQLEWMMLDTGSGPTMLTYSAARRMELKKRLTSDHLQSEMGVVPLYASTVCRMFLGAVVLRNVEVQFPAFEAPDLSPAPYSRGILGSRSLQDLVIDIDYDRKRVTVTRPIHRLSIGSPVLSR